MMAGATISETPRPGTARTVSIPARRAVSPVLSRTLVPSAGASSLATSTAGFPPRSGWHVGHTDSGKPCSLHQSPFAWKTAASFGLHRVHSASRTPCSLQTPSACAVSCFPAGTGREGSAVLVDPAPQPSAKRSGISAACRMRDRMSLASLRRYLRGPHDLEVGIALEVLGQGKTVDLAPVSGGLEGRDERFVAAGVPVSYTH